jgi:hypothetical protein
VRRWITLGLLLVGCATAGEDDDTNTGRRDAGPLTADARPKPDVVYPDAEIIPDAEVADVARHPVDAEVIPDPPDAGTQPDATPVITPDAGCVKRTVQLLANGNLDSSTGSGTGANISPWSFSSVYLEGGATGFSPVVTSSESIVGTHSGGYTGWFGGDYDTLDRLQQIITIPANGAGVRVKGYRRIATKETAGIWDVLELQILDSSGNTLRERVGTFSNANASDTWTLFDFTATGNYAGQTVMFRIESETDFSNNTNFFFDSFSVEVSVCD